MSSVRYEVRDGIAEILLDHAPVNALNAAVLDELLQALYRARDDKSARAVILGSVIPGRFCAGLNLDAVYKGTPSQLHAVLEKLYVQLCDAQFNLGKPSIAAVTGSARGGGMTVAISCDLIIASDSASFGYPEIDLGLIPAIHFTHLPRIVGRARAFDLLFTGRTFGAQEALSLGLINTVVEQEGVMGEARKLAQTLRSKSPQVMRLARSAFMRAIDSDYRRGVSGAVESFCYVAATEDSREGVSAFVEKRQPVWRD